MAKGYYLVIKDKTTCGGIITEGDPTHTLFGKAIAREQDRVTCGKHPGMFIIVGHIPGDSVMGRKFAGTLHSKSSCPCQARFIPSMINDTYEFGAGQAQHKFSSEQSKQPVLSPYITGEKTDSGFVPDYPATALINTYIFPDNRIRDMLQANSTTVMLLTLAECFDLLGAWHAVKIGWVNITQSEPGKIIVNYGLNGRDIVNTSVVIAKLGSFGITATKFVNEKGTELIKISGYAGIRKILNAPVFSLENPQIIKAGIGKYGLRGAMTEGATITFIFVTVYRTVDFILNDQTTLAMFIGNLATDVAKLAINTTIMWGIGEVLVAFVPVVAVPLGVVVLGGLGIAIILNVLDTEFGVTDKVVACLTAAQQEFVETARSKSRDVEKGIWDLGAMFADKMLEKGVEVIESEVMKYLRNSINDITPRVY
ncbi:PAAR domain-containing protein [Hafnia psychrotolerans]|uniref:PAAR domain-containing protein n=1 Tax=Hafnia psychrotolerans TaxID=1477018 RepID=A0ABQ1H7R5_9GAMM|nr:PAAR domain-containing protein [Hafnia psychrotolerans]GGA61854.1 hypothetical protein GCM10011328_41420 [Hafnia psychrotolerans]